MLLHCVAGASMSGVGTENDIVSVMSGKLGLVLRQAGRIRDVLYRRAEKGSRIASSYHSFQAVIS